MSNTASTASVRTGPCAPWIQAQDVLDEISIQQVLNSLGEQNITLAEDRKNAIASKCALQAQEILYKLTAQRYTGHCGPVTVRPVSRPIVADNRRYLLWNFSGWGSLGSFYPSAIPPTVSTYGRNEVPVIELGPYPVTKIVQVKIDGIVIPPDEYDLRDAKHLVRMRVSTDSSPTARYGWPTSQTGDLPDTQFNTFSITYEFGLSPGPAGKDACVKLAAYIMLYDLNNPMSQPQRVVDIVRQGMSMQITSPIDMMKNGRTGIEVVDFWIWGENPNGLRENARAYSPDRPPLRRQGRPTIPS